MQPSPVRFARFAIVGCAGFLVDLGALYLLIAITGLDPHLARAPSFVVAATFTWLANRRYTFGQRCAVSVSEWFRFLVANALGSLVNLLTYSFIVWVAPSGFTSLAVAVGAGSIAGLAFNFLASQRWVFTAATSPSRPPA